MIRALCIACVCGALAGPALAQARITPEQFLDQAVGHTLHFHLFGSGRLVGIEQFLSRQWSVWKPRGGACVFGRITIESGQLCFLYDGETAEEKSCWYTFVQDGQLMVRGTEMFGAEVQVVEQISDVALPCPNAPTS